MNYKLLFPTYRNRYIFVRKQLEQLAAEGRRPLRALNLGTGEGDYDPMISRYCASLIACDINEQDVAFARQLNAAHPEITYQVENALALGFPENHFDLVTSMEVIEHVGQPEQMMAEVARVLQPGGSALITFPSLDFPFTYDPINRVLAAFGKKNISQGAYAFGHDYLISPAEFRQWAEKYGLRIQAERNLSGYLVGLLEMYWTGILQSIFKANSTNLASPTDRAGSLRPSLKEPKLALVTDLILAIDQTLFGKSRHAVGKGFVLVKK